jgi:hypothetical protein
VRPCGYWKSAPFPRPSAYPSPSPAKVVTTPMPGIKQSEKTCACPWPCLLKQRQPVRKIDTCGGQIRAYRFEDRRHEDDWCLPPRTGGHGSYRQTSNKAHLMCLFRKPRPQLNCSRDRRACSRVLEVHSKDERINTTRRPEAGLTALRARDSKGTVLIRNSLPVPT